MYLCVCKYDMKVKAKLPRGTKGTNRRRGDKKRGQRVEGNMLSIQYLLELNLLKIKILNVTFPLIYSGNKIKSKKLIKKAIFA